METTEGAEALDEYAVPAVVRTPAKRAPRGGPVARWPVRVSTGAGSVDVVVAAARRRRTARPPDIGGG